MAEAFASVLTPVLEVGLVQRLCVYSPEEGLEAVVTVALG